MKCPITERQPGHRANQGSRTADQSPGPRAPDGQIFLSLFKSPASVITAAELLAEIGDCRERYPTRDALAADAGQAAVAHESGKWKTGGFRRACNKRLRVALCRLADSSRHWHPWAQDLYAQARHRGHEHPRAIRTLGRAWCHGIGVSGH